jgi:hypothetical protein
MYQLWDNNYQISPSVLVSTMHVCYLSSIKHFKHTYVSFIRMISVISSICTFWNVQIQITSFMQVLIDQVQNLSRCLLPQALSFSLYHKAHDQSVWIDSSAVESFNYTFKSIWMLKETRNSSLHIVICTIPFSTG